MTEIRFLMRRVVEGNQKKSDHKKGILEKRLRLSNIKFFILAFVTGS